MVSGVKSEEGAADLQASQAVFCFRGGGKVFASSCMWFCADWEGKAKAGGVEVINRGKEKKKQATCAVRRKIVGQHCSAGGRTGEETIARQKESNPSQGQPGIATSVPNPRDTLKFRDSPILPAGMSGVAPRQ